MTNEIRQTFTPVEVSRRTAETEFSLTLSPRTGDVDSLNISNRLLSHFLDHFSRGSGIVAAMAETDWPGSWQFDHVLCEDLGQLFGAGVAAIARERTASVGMAGRASASGVMDDASTSVQMSLESRPRCTWNVEPGIDIDGFVDSWYNPDGVQAGQCFGTNLRQFLDGFVLGSGATVAIAVQAGTNLHHVYEVIFRALGDAVGAALGTAVRLPGDGSGLAGAPRYETKTIQ
jgi:imidazoleglycerol-phosphate dehydratase